MAEIPLNNEDAHKDSCNYGIDLSKQFITLSVAGIAFVGGLAIAKSSVLPKDNIIIIFVSLGLSIVFGLLFIMKIIGHINRFNNYDVYTVGPRLMALIQLICFVVGIGYLAHMSMASVNMSKLKLSEMNQPILTIVSDADKLTYPLTHGDNLNLKIYGTCELDIK